MTALGRISALILRIVLSAYFLYFAFQIHTHQEKYAQIINKNVQKYYSLWNQNQSGILFNFEVQIVNYYTKFLCMAALFVFLSLPLNRFIRLLAFIANIALLWSNAQLVMIGIHLVMLGVML